MANTRSVKNPGIFASAALTTIPGSPTQGVAYRDPVDGAAAIGDGWPYATPVQSQDWNEIMYRVTSLLDLVDRKGVLGWFDAVVYSSFAVVFGSDGQLYMWLQANGPGTAAGARDPVSQPAYWQSFSSLYNPADPAASTTVAGRTRYATGPETAGLIVASAAVTPAGLASLLATTVSIGLSRFATAAETLAGGAGNVAVTPNALAQLTSTTARRGLIRSATPDETRHGGGTDIAVTPSSLFNGSNPDNVPNTIVRRDSGGNAWFNALVASYLFGVAQSADRLQTSGGNAPSYACRMWGVIDGTSGAFIAGLNVGGVQRVGQGNYIITMIAPSSNGAAIVPFAQTNGSHAPDTVCQAYPINNSQIQIRVYRQTGGGSTTPVDANRVHFHMYCD